MLLVVTGEPCSFLSSSPFNLSSALGGISTLSFNDVQQFPNKAALMRRLILNCVCFRM